MKKALFLLFILLYSAFNLNAQNLQGKILYSHHNNTAGINPDSIYSIGNNGQRTFVTLGFRPRLSHHGNYMAFSNGSLPNNSIQANLWIRNLNTQKDTQIVFNNDYLDYYDFSPSDSVIVYSQGCSMFTTNIDGTNAYHDIGCTPCDCFSDDPTVRFADSILVFHNVHYGIFTKKFTGDSLVQVPNTVAGDLFPLWSPDGQWIAYNKTTPGLFYQINSIYKIKPTGNDSTPLLHLAVTDTLAPDPVWATDMQNIYFIARINDLLGIYKVQTDGSGVYKRIYAFDATQTVNDYWLGLSDSVSSTLPVTLMNFEGTYLSKTVNLYWQTTREINSSYFNIERSVDGIHFSEIGNVVAKENSSTINKYLFIDAALPLNIDQRVIYYRLKMVDKDAGYTYSKIVSVTVLQKNAQLMVYPNPNKGTFDIITRVVTKNLEINILGMDGRNIYHHTFNNISSQLIHVNAAKGEYLMKIIADNKTIWNKMIIQ